MATAICPICGKPLFPNVAPGRPPIYKCPDHGAIDDDKIQWRSDPDDPVVLREETGSQHTEEKRPHEAEEPDDDKQQQLEALLGGGSPWLPDQVTPDLWKEVSSLASWLAASDMTEKTAIARRLRERFGSPHFFGSTYGSKPWAVAYWACIQASITRLMVKTGLRGEGEELLRKGSWNFDVPSWQDTDWIRLGVRNWLEAYHAVFPENAPAAVVLARDWAPLALQVLKAEIGGTN